MGESVLDKLKPKTPLLAELEEDLTDEMKDTFMNIGMSPKTEKMLKGILANLYNEYGDKYMVVIKANKKVNGYVFSVIPLDAIESFKIKSEMSDKIKSFTGDQLQELGKNMLSKSDK